MASAASPPEDEVRLVLLAMAGGEAAFRILVTRHQAGVRALMRRTCGDAALADDLAQEAFLKAWLNIGKLRAPEGFAAWVRRIAVNAAIDAARRRGPAARSLDEDAANGSDVRAPDQRLDLDAALMTLKFDARLCVLLFHGEELSHAEIAAETGIPVGTVKSHIARATPVLRAALQGWRSSDD